ncbi:MAG: type II toxin-antitoxin system VapC family toxin [Oscillospiraceae bacterium]|jgi:tRNA(fMet)-specific endonuclease VapC|nr:type II toxin-antitoxin system VapC family toxin [Oscillospiraceae bacterium]
MTYFLDTNICIYYLNGTSDSVAEKLNALGFTDVKIPSMVAAELYYGAEKSGKREQNRAVSEKFLSLYEIVPFEERAAEHYAKIRAELERGGQLIGNNDIVIAATALAFGGVLVTHNTGEFSRVDGLAIEDWVEPPTRG